MATAPAPGTLTAPPTADDMAITIVVDGVSYTTWPKQMTAKDSIAIRREVGISFPALLQMVQTEPDIDIIAAFVWIARRQAGEKVSFDEVAGAITYNGDFDVAVEGAAIPEDHPSS